MHDSDSECTRLRLLFTIGGFYVPRIGLLYTLHSFYVLVVRGFSVPWHARFL